MSVAPYKFNERRSSFGYSNNNLYQAATTSGDRKAINPLDYDTARNVSGLGRRTLMTIARWLFSNFPAIEGAILEQANLSVATFIPQFWGKDKAWGEKSENWLLNWFEINNIAGWLHDGFSYRNLMVISALRDGDMFTLLTESPYEKDYPMIQIIPGHRVGCRLNEKIVQGGQYDGARLCDGVILDEYGRPLAYRVLDENGYYGNYQDISARDIFPSFDLKWADQCRGFSALASSIFDWQDVSESRRFELIAQKVAAAIYLIEQNETGEVNEAEAVIQGAATYDADGKKTADAVETISGGIRYFKAGKGCKIDSSGANRPTENSRAFQDSIIRDAMAGMEWSYFFSVDPTNPGGAGMRIVVERINRVLAKLQRMVRKSKLRVCGYGLSKAIKMGVLDESPEWWKWDFQGPPEITADKKYDSDVDQQEYRCGFVTLKRICAKRGEYWEDVQDQKIDERKRLEEKCAEAKIDPNDVQLLTPNAPAEPAQAAQAPAEEQKAAA